MSEELKRFRTTVDIYITNKQYEYIKANPEFVESLDNAISEAISPYKKFLAELPVEESPDKKPERKFKRFWVLPI